MFPFFPFYLRSLSLTRLALETSEEVTYPMFLLMLFPFAIPYQSHVQILCLCVVSETEGAL